MQRGEKMHIMFLLRVTVMEKFNNLFDQSFSQNKPGASSVCSVKVEKCGSIGDSEMELVAHVPRKALPY